MRWIVLIAAIGALGAGCTSDVRSLGDDFIMGTSVAGFQVDMGCPTLPAERCEDRASDWYAFVTSTVTQSRASNFLSGDPVSLGPGFFELYPQDVDRIAALGLDGFRFSIEWSRVFPSSTVGVEGHDALKAIASEDALTHYRDLLARLKAKGITPLVTLHHYTLPSWMHDAVGCNTNLDRCAPRGWLDPELVPELAKYAGFVARELGAEVDLWATLNEPLAVVLPGFLLPSVDRTNPPAASLRFADARTAMVRMIEAHARMVDAVRGADTIDADGDGAAVQIGLVYPVTPVLPKDPDNPLDRIAAKNAFYLLNEVFLNGVITGVLDHDLDGVGELREDLAGRSDYLGLNYYTAAFVRGDTESLADDFSPLLTINPLECGDDGECRLEIDQGAPYAQGLRDMLRYVHETYSVPIYITENGTYPELQDQEQFLVEHLQYTLQAIHEDGVDVRGYFWWSLIDNYEWNHGLDLRFGLYSYDSTDPMKTRAERPFAATYRQIAADRAVSSDLADRFPVVAGSR